MKRRTKGPPCAICGVFLWKHPMTGHRFQSMRKRRDADPAPVFTDIRRKRRAVGR